MNAVGRLKIDDPVLQRKKSEIAALADKFAGREHIALLANENAAGRDQLTAETLHAPPLGIRIAAVFRTTAAFFCCHKLFSLDRLRFMNGFDLDLQIFLAMAPLCG